MTARNHLEIMGSTEKAAVRIAEDWTRKRSGKTDIIHGRVLLVDSNENMCGQGNFKRKAVTDRNG